MQRHTYRIQVRANDDTYSMTEYVDLPNYDAAIAYAQGLAKMAEHAGHHIDSTDIERV